MCDAHPHRAITSCTLVPSTRSGYLDRERDSGGHTHSRGHHAGRLPCPGATWEQHNRAELMQQSTYKQAQM